MHTISRTLIAAFSLAAAHAWAQAPAPGGEPGFFRPSANPSLTAPRPEPVPAPVRQADSSPAPLQAPPAPQPEAAPVDAANEIRKAEEAAMDRVEAVHDRAMADARVQAPVITSPLDGTARIMSPLDGTAPLVTPTAR